MFYISLAMEPHAEFLEDCMKRQGTTSEAAEKLDKGGLL